MLWIPKVITYDTYMERIKSTEQYPRPEVIHELALTALDMTIMSIPMQNKSEWEDHAVCAQADPDLWFPDGEWESADVTHAKQICSGCPVMSQCLEFALTYPQAGIWGGTTESERRRMYRTSIHLSNRG